MEDRKFGEALAKAMDRLDKMGERGDLEGCELEEVLVIAVYSRPGQERDEVEPDQMEVLIFVDGTTQLPHVQAGIIALAQDTVVNPL